MSNETKTNGGLIDRLASLFPDENMDLMDSADFTDKAGETFSLVLEARAMLAEREKGVKNAD